MDLGLKLRIAFCKNIASGFKRKAVWIGEALSWTKKRGRARSSLPYFKVMFGDLMEKSVHLNIDWLGTPSKNIYIIVCNDLYGDIFPYKYLDDTEKQVCLKNIEQNYILKKET